MIGLKLKRSDGEEFVVSGQTATGGWVVQQTSDFSAPREMSTAAIAEEFGSVEEVEAIEADEARGWHALAVQSRAVANLSALRSGDLHPEDDDINKTVIGDRHESGRVREPDLPAGSPEHHRYLAALKVLARRARGGSTPEDVFSDAAEREAAQAKRDAATKRRNAAKVKADAERDVTGTVTKGGR